MWEWAGIAWRDSQHENIPLCIHTLHIILSLECKELNWMSLTTWPLLGGAKYCMTFELASSLCWLGFLGKGIPFFLLSCSTVWCWIATSIFCHPNCLCTPIFLGTLTTGCEALEWSGQKKGHCSRRLFNNSGLGPCFKQGWIFDDDSSGLPNFQKWLCRAWPGKHSLLCNLLCSGQSMAEPLAQAHGIPVGGRFCFPSRLLYGLYDFECGPLSTGCWPWRRGLLPEVYRFCLRHLSNCQTSLIACPCTYSISCFWQHAMYIQCWAKPLCCCLRCLEYTVE